MLETQNRRDKHHLINLISRRSNDTPNFALLIGAGASVSSGVKPTSEMIAEWHQQLYEQSRSRDPFDKWLAKQYWYEDEEEYAILFEKVYDECSQRRNYIEECVKGAKPSWGYIYLANIIAHNYFNVTFTPNFDDLLNEACFLYADLRPIVCAHDSAVADIRITSARPKIIKLHGDFLYDSIKNTIRETETLEKNMRDKFMQFAQEYGLVVIGYGGNDRSIMDILCAIARSEGYFPNGLYWCVRNKEKPSKKLHRLMQQEKAHWVEIEGFDEFMAELHKGLGLLLPDTVQDPYKATTEKLNRFVLPREKTKHPIIKEDIARLEEQIKKYGQVVSGRATAEESIRLLPSHLLASIKYSEHNYEDALLLYEKALGQDPGNLKIMQQMVYCYVWTEQFEKALEQSEIMIKQASDNYLGYYAKGFSLSYLDKPKGAIRWLNKALKYARKKEERENLLITRSNDYLTDANWKKALSDAEEVLRTNPTSFPAALVNRCIALKKLGRQDEAKIILQEILPRIENRYHRACVFATLGDKKNMLKSLKAAIKEDRRYRVEVKFDPDFADYQEDPDFRKLVYEEPSKRRIRKRKNKEASKKGS